MTNNKRQSRKKLEETGIISVYYCPNCKAGKEFQVEDEKNYVNGKQYSYVCHKCTARFKIKELRHK